MNQKVGDTNLNIMSEAMSLHDYIKAKFFEDIRLQAEIARLARENAALWAKCNTYSVQVTALERELEKVRLYLPAEKKMNPAKAWPLEKIR